MEPLEGTGDTRDFYDKVGWQVNEAGQTADAELFGVREDGPIRQRIYARRWARILDFIGTVPEEAAVLEVGCGGSPEARLFDAFSHYTGVDFSEQGIAVARSRSMAAKPDAVFRTADAVALPFADGSFDCVYSAHMIYHIADPAAQGRALSEMVRVLRPGGALVLHAANPRPLLFPLRMLFRMVAETPGLADLARRIKGPSLVPYNPQRIAWTLRRISTAGPIIVIGGGIASTAFNRNVTEFRAHGKFAWRAFEMIEERWPRSAANLGNYVVYMVRKST